MNRREQGEYPQERRNFFSGKPYHPVGICSPILKVKPLWVKAFRAFQLMDRKGLGLDMATIPGGIVGKRL